MFFKTDLEIFSEDLLFLVFSTLFLLLIGWWWRKARPFMISQIPVWFNAWLSLVIIIGFLLPLGVTFWWGIWQQNMTILNIFLSYYLIVGLQILFESIVLRKFQSCIWVTIPCLYLPYRIWQLYRGWVLLSANSELFWLQNLLLLEIILWIFNYGVHLSQIPRLMQWEEVET
jgi:hypothetical protein